MVVGVGVELPNSCRSTLVGVGRTEVWAISVLNPETLLCSEAPNSCPADPEISLDAEYSNTSKNCPRLIRSFRFCRMCSSLATYVDETVSASF